MPEDTVQIDAFAMEISDVQTAELDQLYALSISVGWPHRAEDWQFLRETGKGVVATDEIGRIMSSAMWFRQAPDLATIGMVITSPRLQTQGAGLWLMDHALKDLEGVNLRLNATRAAQRLYLSLGFLPEKTVYQCQGVVTNPPDADRPVEGELRVLTDADREAAIALDAGAFGVARAPLMHRLFAVARGYGLFREGVLKAFALCRPFGRGHVVGPIVAGDDADAIAVLAPHLREAEGRFLRLDTHFSTGDFALVATGSGLSLFDTVLTMSKGKSLADFLAEGAHPPLTYALVSQTLG
ncbi:GNAT family N-acetyltransferase [Allorhizobium sp. BGMRC 0089]|uniref:GNAT family N-acetyltransferase n=1 Tax=Allorhizobium sonneratiae TaxID=2934936 RepID=UPI00203399F1|nr:GNAT family N-acetyltransferase [Allorhizobium sonneratiae]MCM2292702.1 GNAT family N-acetyltransferase [Allorhizobium sonneratiae]